MDYKKIETAALFAKRNPTPENISAMLEMIGGPDGIALMAAQCLSVINNYKDANHVHAQYRQALEQADREKKELRSKLRKASKSLELTLTLMKT